MLIHGMKILVCFHAIYSHLAILFCREALFLQVWVIPTLARVVIKKMARIMSSRRFYHHFGENSFVDDRACDICYSLACFSTRERSVSLLIMYFEDTRYGRWLFFLL